MTNKFLFSIAALLLNFCTYAQTVVIGAGSQNGTSSNGATGDPGPMYRSSNTSNFVYSMHHYLYTQAELATAGIPIGSTITSLAWNKDDNSASNANFLFQIWMKNSSLSAVPSPPQTLAALTTGATQVYNSAATSLPTAIGFVNFATTPFVYTGGALEITVNFDMSSGTSPWTTAGVSWKKDPSTNTTLSYCGSTASTSLGNLRTVRPQLQITYSACNTPTGVNATGITTSMATINWAAVSGSLGYEYVIDQNPGNPSGAGIATLATSQHLPGLTNSTTYYFHLRNKCSTAFSSWVNYSFKTDDATCKAPANIVFSNITSKTADVLWTFVANATTYQYYTDIVRVPPVAGNPGIKTITGISTQLTGLTPDTMNYFFVRTMCLSGADSSIWKIDSFRTDRHCAMPEVQVLNVTNTAADAVWFTVPGAITYEYVVTESEAIPAFGTPTTDTVAALVLDEHKKKQYVHVRAKCNSQFTFSDWNTKLVVDKTTSVTDINNPFAPALFPNPAKDILTISNAKDAVLTIADLKGSVVKKSAITGDKESLTIKDMQAGIYIVDISTASGQHYRYKLVKM